MYFTAIFVFCRSLANNKRGKLDCMAKKLFTCTQAWPSLGAWRIFFLIFLQDRKSTSLLTVIKTLAQIPRKKPNFLPYHGHFSRGKGQKGEEPYFFDGVHCASAEAQHNILFFGLLLFPSASV